VIHSYDFESLSLTNMTYDRKNKTLSVEVIV
jgi:hypothetical protein